MYNTSVQYKEQINSKVRNVSYLKINFGIVNDVATNNNITTDNGHLFYSNVDDIDYGLNVEKRYLTMEHNKFILDGKNILPPELGGEVPYFQGFVSDKMSDASGNFATPPKITVDFPVPYAFMGLTFRFNKYHNNYPSELTVKAYNDGVEIYSSTKYPSSFDYVFDEPVPAPGLFTDKIEIIFNKTYPAFRRAELEYLMFGIVATFTESTITKSTWDREVDLNSTKLPRNNFTFTILDENKDYNPENVTGVWQYLEERQPVWFQYGYKLNDGSIEWIDGSNLYSNGVVKLEGTASVNTVTFTTESILNSLDEYYYKGVYNPLGISLYDLAVDVLEFAELPLLHGGVFPYIVTDDLKAIKTKVPLPDMKIKELLQLIANAGRCIINIDRLGRIVIERTNNSISDFKYDFANTFEPPTLSKSQYLLSVDTFSNRVVVGSSSEIHKSDITLSIPTECRLTYNPSTEVSISVSSGLSIIGVPIYYANSCIVTLSGSGQIIITGKKLEFATNSISYKVGLTGFVCPIENILLNSDADALLYAQWIAGVLMRRNLYNIKDRGYPEIDLLDLILTDTLFTDSMETEIIGSKIMFDGALSGETKHLSKEVL